MSLVAEIPLLAQLSKVEQAKLLGDLEELHLSAGATVLAPGDPLAFVYFVLEGAIEVSCTSHEKNVPFTVLGSGQFFGEPGLLGPQQGAGEYGMRAVSAARICRMPALRLTRLLETEPALAQNFIRALSAKISGLNREMARTKGTLSVYMTELWSSVPAPDMAEAAADMPLQRPEPLLENAPPTVRGMRPAPEQRPILAMVNMVGSIIAAIVMFWALDGTRLAALSAILLWAAWNWLIGTLPDYVTALAVITAAAVTGVVAPKVALSGFAAPSWFLLLGVLGIGMAVSRSGLLYRIVLHMLRLVPPTYLGQSLALAVAGWLFTPLLPSANSRTAMASLLSRELSEAMHLPALGKGSAGLAMSSFLGFGQMYFMFLNGTSVCLVAWSLLPETVRREASWLTWFWLALPLGLVIFTASYLAILWMYPPESTTQVSRRTIMAQLSVLGPLNHVEKVTTAVLGVVLVGFMTQQWHGIDPTWIALSGFLVLIAQGAIDKAGLKGLDWGFLLLVGTLISMAEITKATGLNEQLTAWIGPVLRPLGANPYIFLGAIGVLTVLVSLAVTAQQAMLMMIIALLPITTQLGYNPLVVALVILATGSGWVLPHQNPVYLTAYSGTDGRAFTHKQVRPLALVEIAISIVAVLASVPFWHMLRLIP